MGNSALFFASARLYQPQSIFTTQIPAAPDATDGTGSAGDNELGLKFQSSKSGNIYAVRFYKALSETGTHVGRIWTSTGTLLGSTTFTAETGSGWQQQALATPIAIAANTTYMVSVNTLLYYVYTGGVLTTSVINGDLSTVVDASNGCYDLVPGLFPTTAAGSANFFRDVVFSV